MIRGTVAIVGRPNVGKSTIFNRLIGQRKSIVDDTPGVTRDRIYGEVEWLTQTFRLIDTGGIQIEDQAFAQEINMQVDIAIEEADVIIFLTSAKEGVMTDDTIIARKLQKCKKPVILACNKVDNPEMQMNVYEFYALGLGDPIAISGAHGIGLGDLLDVVMEKLPEKDIAPYEGITSFCCIGRPNVGKSSLVNSILKEDRVIVSNVEGTTRDAIDTPFFVDDKEYMIIDTAGIRKKGKIYENIEKYSVLRALKAVEQSDVILCVVDGERGIIEQDKHVAGYAHELGKSVVLVVNKWDAVTKDEKTMAKMEKNLREQFKYLDYARIAFVSALKKQRINTLFDLIVEAYMNAHKRVTTSVLNDVIVDAQAMNPTTTFEGGRLKIYYANQVAVQPPTFVLFVNDPKFMHFSYKRYLENCLRDRFGFEGTPIHIICRKRD